MDVRYRINDDINFILNSKIIFKRSFKKNRMGEKISCNDSFMRKHDKMDIDG